MDEQYNTLHKYLQNLNLTETVIFEVMSFFSVKHYKKDEHFSVAGQIDDKIGFVVNGLFYMYVSDKDGKIFTKNFLREKQFLLASFNSDMKSAASICAIRDSAVLQAPYSDIRNLFKKYPEFELLSRKRSEAEIKTIYERLESFSMMESKERYLLFRERFSDIEQDIPQYLIASYLGITPTQLSRVRKQLNILHHQHM